MPSDDLYESTSFHDNHIHGFSILEEEHCSGSLVLDLDHIVQWLPPVDGRYHFLLAPALLTFHDISALVISINYAAVSAAIVPLSIREIRREPVVYPNGYQAWKWTISLNWPQGEFSFDSAGFTLALQAQPIQSEGQYLSPVERQTLLASKR